MLKFSRLGLALALIVAVAGCAAPQEASIAQKDLVLTSEQAGQNSVAAKSEAQAMRTITKDMKIDVKNIKDVENFFDKQPILDF